MMMIKIKKKWDYGKKKKMTAIKEKLLVPTYKIYKKEEFG